MICIERIILRELAMRLKAPFETSSDLTWNRRILLVEVNANGLAGWGEITTGEDPFYNSETTDTAWHIFKDFLVPAALGKALQTASEVPALLAQVRGHQMAKAGLENALWDIEAQQRGMSIAALLGGTQPEIPSGVSIGIQNSLATLLDKIDVELNAGYQRIKIKIKPGKDLEPVVAIRAQYPGIKLMVDANSAYRLADVDRLKAFDAYNLMMIEQPLAWDDIYQHAKLQAQLQTAICLDECISTPSQAEGALAMGACRIINIKLGRVGGHSLARQVHDICLQNSAPVWCGGMLESGVGRAHNIAMSALPGFTLPGDVSASQRYWNEDIIEPEVEVTAQGTIVVPATAGLGYTVRRARVEALTVRTQRWNARAQFSIASDDGAAAPAPKTTRPPSAQAASRIPPGRGTGEVTIRDLGSFAELEQVEALEQDVWGIPDREITPASFLVAAKEAGAIILGAFDGNDLVGFAFGILGKEAGEPAVHSHTLGVRPAYRDHNLGFRLKLAQRERALQLGVLTMTWTFDPLRSRNAYLNFAKLGVLCDSYKIDFYGDHSPSVLHQGGTDRLWVRWQLNSDRVRDRLSGNKQPAMQAPSAVALLRVGEQGEPVPGSEPTARCRVDSALLEIPIDRDGISNAERVAQWRKATRHAFTEALRAGMMVTDFYFGDRNGRECGAYLLSPRAAAR